jgi:hypothetical protein
MNLRTSIVAIALVLVSSFSVAQPKAPSERKDILNALRQEVQKELNQSVTFKVEHFSAAKDWAFLTGIPMQQDGKSIDYSKTSYQDAIDAEAFDDGIAALLKKVHGKWVVKAFTIGATDVPWVCWWKEFSAPKEIFIAIEEGCNE